MHQRFGMRVELYQPIDVPKPVAEDIWIVDGPIVRMALYGAKVPFSTRMTVVRLGDGGLWLHSPTAPSPALMAEIDRIGPVRHLVSPNKIHYAHIAAWKEAYPAAVAWASPGVRERAASQKIQVAFDRDLGDEAPPDWSTGIDQLVFRGSRYMDELAFLHRASRTLILADLIENFEAERMSRGFRTLARLGGILDPDGQTPRDLRMTFLGRKDQARQSFEQMLAWQPERIIIAHGRCYDRNAEAELRRAFRWLT